MSMRLDDDRQLAALVITTSHGSAPPSLSNGIWFSERNPVAQIIAGFAIKRYTGIADTHLELYVRAFCRSLFEYCADLDTAQ